MFIVLVKMSLVMKINASKPEYK